MVVPFEYPGEGGRSITDIIQFMQYVNTLCEGMLGIGMLIVIFFVAFLSTKTWSFDRSLGFSSFLTLISAVFLRFMSVINDVILFLTIAIFLVAILVLMRERNVEQFGT